MDFLKSHFGAYLVYHVVTMSSWESGERHLVILANDDWRNLMTDGSEPLAKLFTRFVVAFWNWLRMSLMGSVCFEVVTSSSGIKSERSGRMGFPG